MSANVGKSMEGDISVGNPFRTGGLMKGYLKDYNEASENGFLDLWEQDQASLLSEATKNPYESNPVMGVLEEASKAILKGLKGSNRLFHERGHAIFLWKLSNCYNNRGCVDPQPRIVEDRGDAMLNFTLQQFKRWESGDGLAGAWMWASKIVEQRKVAGAADA